MKNCGHRSLTAIVNLKMSPRLLGNTKWLWCILMVYFIPAWKPVNSVSVRAPPNPPETVEAQAKFFQDFFSVQLSPYKMEFGHVCEDPNTWEQRYEKKDFKNHRDMGKVRWGDKKGGYGEHYWDLNHAGHADNHNDDGDDGSYSVHDNEDPYDEPSEQQVTYNDEYDPEQSANYEESNRAKRHHKDKSERKDQQEEVKTLRRRIRDEKKKTDEESDNIQEELNKYQPSKLRYKPKELNYDGDRQNPNSPSTVVSAAQPENHHVPYESGAGIRQHQHAEVAAASAPRMFLDPSTGHVVDRVTGQAYILQPIVANYQ